MTNEVSNTTQVFKRRLKNITEDKRRFSLRIITRRIRLFIEIVLFLPGVRVRHEKMFRHFI